MATTKIKFRPSSVPGREGTLFLQVIHRRVVRQVSTSYRLYPHEWDRVGQSVVVCVVEDAVRGEDAARGRYLRAVQEGLREDWLRMQLIIFRLEQAGGAYRAEDVVRLFRQREQVREFSEFAEMLIAEKREQGRASLAAKYTLSLNSFRRFVGRGAPVAI